MLHVVRRCVFAETPLLMLIVLCLQPAAVSCYRNCSESGHCPGHYLCCYDQHCCPLSERMAELAGAVSGVAILFGGVGFCCFQCCRTRRQYACSPVLRVSSVVATPAATTAGAGECCTETSALIHDQPVSYGSHHDIS